MSDKNLIQETDEQEISAFQDWIKPFIEEDERPPQEQLELEI